MVLQYGLYDLLIKLQRGTRNNVIPQASMLLHKTALFRRIKRDLPEKIRCERGIANIHEKRRQDQSLPFLRRHLKPLRHESGENRDAHRMMQLVFADRLHIVNMRDRLRTRRKRRKIARDRLRLRRVDAAVGTY